MANITRRLVFELPEGQSAFVWGARKTGKSTFLRSAFPESAFLDLLNREIQESILKEPGRFQQWVGSLKADQLKKPIIVDEVQKVPVILDDIHLLIESRKLSFILCGSSARKLKLNQANLLGGRAWKFNMHPLCFAEVPDLDLLGSLQTGLIPQHYKSNHAKKFLRSYLQDYLTEEVRAEALTRNFGAFSKFLDAFSFSHGEICVYQNIASDCGIDGKTVRNYFEILIDTLLAHEVLPYSRRETRQVISKASKFYLFDVGVAGFLQKRTLLELKGKDAGQAFEHFILMELIAYRSYLEKDFDIKFWRQNETREVDFVCQDGRFAIEVKITNDVRGDDLKGMAAFLEVHNPEAAILVCLEPLERIVLLKGDRGKSVRILPWKRFLELLWAGEFPLD